MDKKYIKPGYDQAKWRLLEEMSEVAKEICKAERFGYYNRYPTTEAANIHKIYNELNDLIDAIKRYRNELYITKHSLAEDNLSDFSTN